MPNAKQDKEAKELAQKVRQAASRLEEKHFIWIVDTALRHYQKQIRESEMEILRLQFFINDPHEGAFNVDYDKKEEIAKTQAQIKEFRLIIGFLRALSELLSHMSAVRFAEEFLRTKK